MVLKKQKKSTSKKKLLIKESCLSAYYKFYFLIYFEKVCFNFNKHLIYNLIETAGAVLSSEDRAVF